MKCKVLPIDQSGTLLKDQVTRLKLIASMNKGQTDRSLLPVLMKGCQGNDYKHASIVVHILRAWHAKRTRVSIRLQ